MTDGSSHFRNDDEARWQVEGSSDLTSRAPALVSEILDVFRDGFGIPGQWTADEVTMMLLRSEITGQLRDDGGRLLGYAIYSVPRRLLFGRAVLWEESICLRREAQGIGLANRVVDAAIGMLAPSVPVGWLGGRTQNPTVMNRYSRYGPGYPFDCLYSRDRGPSVLSFLKDNIAEVAECTTVDAGNGICRGAYSEGVLGTYSWNSEGYFETQLNAWGFSREDGDAVAITVRLP